MHLPILLWIPARTVVGTAFGSFVWGNYKLVHQAAQECLQIRSVHEGCSFDSPVSKVSSAPCDGLGWFHVGGSRSL